MPLGNAYAPEEIQEYVEEVAAPEEAPFIQEEDDAPEHLRDYMEPADVTPPSYEGVKFVRRNDDGSALYSNGVSLLRNGSIRWEDKDTGMVYEQKNKYLKAVKMGPKLKPAKPDVQMINDGSGVSLPWERKGDKFVRVPLEGEMTAEDKNIPEGVTGEEAIKHLSPVDQTIVRSFAHYRRQPPAGGRANPTYNRLERHIIAYRPDYGGAVGFGEAKKVTDEFASSRSIVAGGQIVAANTAMRHLSKLSDTVDKLDNGQIRKFSGLVNYLKTETGNPNVQEFNRERDTLVGEFQKMITGGVPYVDDVRRGVDQLNAANSPEQLKAVIKSMAGLMSDKLSELDFRYEKVFRKSYDGLVNPDVNKIALKFGITDFAGRRAGPEGEPAPTATPAHKTSPADAVARAKQIIATSKDQAEIEQAQEVLRIVGILE